MASEPVISIRGTSMHIFVGFFLIYILPIASTTQRIPFPYHNQPIRIVSHPQSLDYVMKFVLVLPLVPRMAFVVALARV